uniref:uncharacterized protein LOC122596998 n=1 Tax=Erigeron canadensis TaxID=72917 RepID=UPI001CB91E10|nr:uncharacterized protein LOC122596998 [Erigeron canadensis]
MEVQDGVDVVLPKESVRIIQDKFANTLYGYFLGDRIAYPVVEYFVKSMWAKFGLQKVMMNASGFFFFKFSDTKGMKEVLDGGPWLIRNIPIFLRKWSPTVQLKKEEIKEISVWVKIHNVPIAAYSDDGLTWGRSSYARALIDISANDAFKDVLSIAIPELDGDGFTKETMKVEYESKPPMCPNCCVFGHQTDSCPKQVPVKQKQVIDEDGFTKVQGKKKNRTGFPIKQKTYGPIVNIRGKRIYQVHLERLNLLNLLSRQVTRMRCLMTSIFKVKVRPLSQGQALLIEGFSMGSIASWNIRGLNRPLKQSEVRQVVKDNNLNVCAILESHMDVSRLFKACKKICRSWDWTSNGGLCTKGTRIILGWNPEVVDAMVLSQTNQVMHVQLMFKVDKKAMFCSFVYADNDYKDRRSLWQNLEVHKVFVHDRPWVILGYFNSSLNLEDNFSGTSTINIGMREFKECVESIEVFDINSPYRVSDHSPCVLKLPCIARARSKPFKFANFLVEKVGFRDIVEVAWDINVHGVNQFRVVKKLKNLKAPLRGLLFKQGNLHKKVECLRNELDDLQKEIDKDPLDVLLREKESDCLKRNHRGRIDVIKDSQGVVCEGSDVQNALVKHYQNFGGAWASSMIREVTNDEIKTAMFSIGENKAPGPDGITSAFFKNTWSIVGKDVLLAVHDFFRKGKLLPEINHTYIVLVPKVSTPSSINDYRPISCCNVLFKCISKILADRIKDSLKEVVGINQSAFVPGRRISDNILLTLLIMHNYHRVSGPPRCSFKVDIQKAYDTVDWGGFASYFVGIWISPDHGRVQLVISVLSSLHLYWASVFILPARIIKDLEKSMRGFLWCQGPMQRGKAKVAWKDVCVPKFEGGLGIRRIDDMNKALMASHIWSILTRRSSLWVEWVHDHHLKGRNFWDIPVRASGSWGWRKLLKMRPTIRNFIWMKLGNGNSISFFLVILDGLVSH